MQNRPAQVIVGLRLTTEVRLRGWTMPTTCLERPQTLNLYSYVTNDPVNQTDPTGLGFFSFLKKVFKIIAIAVAVALIVIAIVTLGQVALLTTLQYFLSAA